jgi:vacuolar protein sorting-associated protein 13A/C
VVGQPYRGAKKNGLLGGMLGLVTGITGIVIKPVTGVLDALTKSSEGLKSTVMGYEDRANTQRIRSPRVFYGGNSLIKSYNPADAQMYQTL